MFFDYATVDEQEFLEKERKKANVAVILIFLLLIVSPFLMILSLKEEYAFLMLPSQIFTYIVGSVTLLFIMWYDSQRSIQADVWFSAKKYRYIRLRIIEWAVIILLISVSQIIFLFYILFDYNMFESEMKIGYILTILMVGSGIPIIYYGRTILRKSPESRSVYLKMREEDAKNILKNALDSMKIAYTEEKGKKKSGEKIWKLERDMEIRIISRGKISKILIDNIPPDWTEKEREIEKEILNLINSQNP